jgi:hypothetical protein
MQSYDAMRRRGFLTLRKDAHADIRILRETEAE